jgi:hypothetical protein
VCGKPLDLWSAVTGLDGRTVCASGDCMGGFLGGLPAEERGPLMPERPDDPPAWAQLPAVPVTWEQRPGESDEEHAVRCGQPGGPDHVDPDWPPDDEANSRSGSWFDEADCGGTFDGFSVSSDADPGL